MVVSRRLDRDPKVPTEGLQSTGAHTGRFHIVGHPEAPIILQEALIYRQQVHILQGLGRMELILEVMTHPFGPFQKSMMRLGEKCSQHTGIPRLQAERISQETLLKPLVDCLLAAFLQTNLLDFSVSINDALLTLYLLRVLKYKFDNFWNYVTIEQYHYRACIKCFHLNGYM